MRSRTCDGDRVVNDARWRSEDDFRAMLGDPVAADHMDRARDLARAEPRLYRVLSTHHA